MAAVVKSVSGTAAKNDYAWPRCVLRSRDGSRRILLLPVPRVLFVGTRYMADVRAFMRNFIPFSALQQKEAFIYLSLFFGFATGARPTEKRNLSSLRWPESRKSFSMQHPSTKRAAMGVSGGVCCKPIYVVCFLVQSVTDQNSPPAAMARPQPAVRWGQIYTGFAHC